MYLLIISVVVWWVICVVKKSLNIPKG